jgi:hypothetical protein
MDAPQMGQLGVVAHESFDAMTGMALLSPALHVQVRTECSPVEL